MFNRKKASADQPRQTYRYRGKVSTAKGTKNVVVEAPTEASARVLLMAYGSSVVKIKRIGKSKAVKGRLSYTDRQVFLSRLSAMLSSGIGASEALTLMHATFKGTVGRISSKILTHLEQGQSLPEAMQNLGPKIVPKATAAMIQAGSYSGETSSAIRGAMIFEREMQTIRRQSGKGIWQAIGGFTTAIIFILGTVFGFLPYIMSSPLMTMTEGGNSLELGIDMAYIVGYVMAAIFAIFMSFFLLGTVVRKIAPAKVDRIILRIPFYKHLILAKNNFIAFYALSFLVGSGVSMQRSFELLSEITPPGALKKEFMQASEAVKEGKKWYEALKTLEPTDRAALAASLDRDQIAHSMSAISTQYQDIYAQRMASFVPVLQGLAAMFLLLSGLIMFGITILPMLQITSQIL